MLLVARVRRGFHRAGGSVARAGMTHWETAQGSLVGPFWRGNPRRLLPLYYTPWDARLLVPGRCFPITLPAHTDPSPPWILPVHPCLPAKLYGQPLELQPETPVVEGRVAHRDMRSLQAVKRLHLALHLLVLIVAQPHVNIHYSGVTSISTGPSANISPSPHQAINSLPKLVRDASSSTPLSTNVPSILKW